MKRFHDYSTFNGLEKLKEIVAKQDPSMSEELMAALFPFRNKNIGQTLNDIINRFESSAEYATPPDWFTPKKFDTFMDYFQRKLTKEKTEEIKSKVDKFAMVMPSEGSIEAIGDFTDTSPILRLKKPTDDVVKSLMGSGISDVNVMNYISIKLLKCFYHRVHCPIDGTIQRITFVAKDDSLFGDNTLWIVEFDSEFGRVYLLVVGELSIQDFDFNFKEGSKVKKFDELGKFNWGSQLVLIFEDVFRDPLIISKEKYFVGDGLFVKRQIQGDSFGGIPIAQIDHGSKGGIIHGGDILGAPTGASIF